MFENFTKPQKNRILYQLRVFAPASNFAGGSFVETRCVSTLLCGLREPVIIRCFGPNRKFENNHLSAGLIIGSVTNLDPKGILQSRSYSFCDFKSTSVRKSFFHIQKYRNFLLCFYFFIFIQLIDTLYIKITIIKPTSRSRRRLFFILIFGLIYLALFLLLNLKMALKIVVEVLLQN